MRAGDSAGDEGRYDGPILALAFLALYLVLAQETLYKVDGEIYLLLLGAGRWLHDFHLLYLPMAFVASKLGALAGGGLYASVLPLSALGVALGLWPAQRALRLLGASRRQALAGCALAGSSPCLAFFATVVEVHGPFFFFCALATCAMARLAARPTRGRALALGAATSGAYLAHASGVLLPALLLPWYLALGARDGRLARDRRLALVALATHALGFALVFALTRVLLGGGTGANQLAFLERGIGNPRRLALLPRVVCSEWLLPHLPLSLCGLYALGVARRRREALAIHAGILPFLALSFLLVAQDPERGAYLVPAVLPLAWLALVTLPQALVAAACGLSLALALAGIARHDAPEAARAWAKLVREATRDAPAVLLLAQPAEVRACLVELPDQPFYPLHFAASGNPAFSFRPSAIEEFLDGPRGRGREVWMSEQSYAVLGAGGSLPAGPAIRAWIDATFAVERVPAGDFAALRLRRR